MQVVALDPNAERAVIDVARAIPEPAADLRLQSPMGAGAESSALLTLADKHRRDKATAFGLVFDTDDVTKSGLDLRISIVGRKGPKCENLKVGEEIAVLGVRVRVLELVPHNERALIEVCRN